MDDERDVEVFERIPWESLDPKPDRRWMAYLLAAAVVLGAVGVSLGRQMGRDVQPTSTTGTVRSTVAHVPDTPTTTVAVATVPVTTWSEADLMALPAESIEAAAAAMAEWYVVDFFTRDEPDGDRSFVEWARAWKVEWESPATASVTVLLRRLAAVGDEPYQRLEAEAWRITTDVTDEGWSVVSGPVQEDAPELVVQPETTDPSLSEWTDPAGVTWLIGTPPEKS